MSILAFTAFAKIMSSFSHSGLLAYYDPLWGIQTRYLLWIVASFEAAVVLTFIISNNDLFKCFLCAVCGGEFLLYRIFNHIIDSPRPCPCLGTLYDWAHVNPHFFDGVVSAMAVYLFAGGTLYFLLSFKNAE